uniref:Aldehyde dehydrogenase n=1 Tax=Rhizophora mucronata TaxID=61149 RepID=A0A2P2K618_RHIMU
MLGYMLSTLKDDNYVVRRFRDHTRTVLVNRRESVLRLQATTACVTGYD